MLKRFFSKPAVSRVEEKSLFFLVLCLGIMRLEGAETLVTQNYNISSSWRELCWKRKNFKKFSKVKGLEFWRQSPPKIIGLNLKFISTRKTKSQRNQNSNPKVPAFFKKEIKKLKISKKILFFYFRGYITNWRWKKRNEFWEVNKLFQFIISTWISEIQLFCTAQMILNVQALKRDNYLYFTEIKSYFYLLKLNWIFIYF